MSQPAASRIYAVIPSRWGSTRFPGKPLHPIAGQPLVQHVWNRCRACEQLAGIVIATDDQRIFDAAEAFGAQVILTSPEHQTGTDRLAEALATLPDATHLINVQGDEPLISPALIDELAVKLAEDATLDMITAASSLTELEDMANPNIVKVVCNLEGNALYFSRSPLPFYRDASSEVHGLRHIGIYGYRRDFLEQFVSWPPGVLEQAESLEQLRALEHGAKIRVVRTDESAFGVDTPEQAEEAEALFHQSRFSLPDVSSLTHL